VPVNRRSQNEVRNSGNNMSNWLAMHKRALILGCRRNSSQVILLVLRV
jgi:hypothetical protein